MLLPEHKYYLIRYQIRNHLGKNLYLKYLPELEFKKDENAEHVEKITRILNELHPESNSKLIH